MAEAAEAHESFKRYVVKIVEARFANDEDLHWQNAIARGVMLGEAHEHPMEMFCCYTLGDDAIMPFESATVRTVILRISNELTSAVTVPDGEYAFNKKCGAMYALPNDRTLLIAIVPKTVDTETLATVVDSLPDGTSIVRHYLLKHSIAKDDPTQHSYAWIEQIRP